MTATVPVPLALRHLIESNKMMRLLGLNPNDGWRLDVDTFTYVKVEDGTSVS